MRLPRSPLHSVALVVAALLLLTACKYEEVDGVGTRTMDEDHPPQADVSFGDCREGDLNRWHASSSVTNNTPLVQTYEVTVGFYDNDVRLAERSHWVRALRPGETAEIDPGWWIDSPERVTDCRLLTVNRFG